MLVPAVAQIHATDQAMTSFRFSSTSTCRATVLGKSLSYTSRWRPETQPAHMVAAAGWLENRSLISTAMPPSQIRFVMGSSRTRSWPRPTWSGIQMLQTWRLGWPFGSAKSMHAWCIHVCILYHLINIVFVLYWFYYTARFWISSVP